MHLVLLLFLGLVVTSQQHCHHHRHNCHQKVRHIADYHSRVFEEVATHVIDLDKKSQQLCEGNSNGGTKEVLDKKRYSLKVALQNFTEDEIKVVVRHKVVYINAFKAGSENNYAEVRVLPPFVNVSDAKYNFEDGILEIVFPKVNTITNSCDPNINDDVITIPKLDIFGGGLTRPRFGEEH